MTFYVLNNSGDITYPLDRQPQEPDDYSRRTRDLYQSNFRFHYDGARNHVVSYFKGRVNTGTGSHLISNQFYAVYYGDGTEQDLLRALKERVESTFDSQGWQTSESDRDANSIYTNLTTLQPVELSVDEGMLLRMIDKDSSGGSDGNPPSNVGQNENYPDGPIQLGAPDYASALRVCKRLIEQVDNIKLTISSSGHESSHPPSDVVVIPGDTDEPGAPTRGTLDWLQRADLSHRIRKANNRLAKFIQEDGARATDLAKAFEDRFPDPSVPNIEDLGVRIDTPERKATRESRLGTAAMLGGSVAGVVLAVLLAVYLDYIERIVEALSSSVSVSSWFISGVSVGITVPSWVILGPCTAIILLFGLGFRRTILVRNTILDWFGAKFGSTTDSPASDAAKQTAKDLLFELREIRDHPAIETTKNGDSAIDRVFDTDSIRSSGLKIYDRSYYRRSIQFVGFSRFGFGLFAAVLGLTFLISVGVLVSQAWLALHYILIVGALVAVASRVVLVVPSGLRSLIDLIQTPNVEVLIVGPEESDPLSHVALLFNHFLTDRGINPDPNETLSKVIHGYDSSDARSGVEPVRFRTDDLTVWTPIAEKNIIGEKVFKKLRDVEQLHGPSHLPESGTRRTGSHVSIELATALVAADVLVLLFPADGAITSTATDSTKNSQDSLPESRRYLYRYQKLLEQYLNDEQRVLGVVTGVGARSRTEGGQGSERIYEQATDWAFEGASDELRDTILERLDNSTDGTLLPIVETDEETEVEREVEQFYY
ncbi:hypothetical protein Z052_01170 [Halorubrum sp. C191]|uniref:hypothetical protein n=1 Tax=Halorubrum sp. C191 TaxID=1383842 RepID=UPI000C07CAE8|nr:hypothetical protein [Halorubrum sp. C191]PHQ43975.1 hypothetical protein Z052_01170 [Halorubrum sp. C191]